MDIKKAQNVSEVKSKKGVTEFGREVKDELRKVDWTSKEELIAYTKIVVVSMFLFGIVIYFIDMLIQGFLGGFNMIFKFFTG